MLMCPALLIAVGLTLAGAATAQDQPIFHASFDGTLTADGPAVEVAPAEVAGPEPSFAPGRFGQALVAGAGQPLVRYPTAGHLLAMTGTVSLWVKPENWTPGDEAFHVFFESGGAGGDRDWLIFYKYYQNGWLLLRASDGEGRVGIAKALDLGWQPGEWHHLAATWSPKGLRIYVDGEFAAQQEAAIVVPDRLGSTFKVGDDGWHVADPEARTLIDDLRIYDYPLPEGEIRRLAGRLALTVTRRPMEGRWDASVRLPVGVAAGTVAVDVRPAEGAEPTLTGTAEAIDGAAQVALDVATLPAGDYTVTAQLTGDQPGVPSSVTMRQPAQATYALANERVRVVFDGATGGILAIEAPDTGLAARASVPPEPLLSAETLSYTRNPWFYLPTDVTEAAVDDRAVRDMRLDTVAGGQRLTIEYELAGGARATVTADLPDAAATIQLRATIANSRPLWPSTAIRIPRVIFPMIGGLRIGESGEDDRLATGLVHGEELANPSAALRTLRVMQYPGRTCVPWQDLFDGAGGGVALSPLTDGMTQLEILTQGREDTMMLGNRWWTLLEPGEIWESPVIELGVHPGAWHPVAERFREWSLTNTPPREQPAWLGECDGWVGAGSSTYSFAQLPEMLETAKLYGLSYIQLWAQMVLGNAYYCYFYPNPELGTVEDLQRGIAAVHAGGGHVGFYSNAICFDGGIDQNPALQALIEQYGLQEEIDDLPRFYEEVAPYVFTGHDGVRAPGTAAGHSLSGYVDGYWPMDPAAPWWREYLARWIMRWHEEYGADVWYLDSFPVHGYGVEPASFGRYLDHPVSTGAAQIGLLQHIRDAGFDGPMLYEGVACAALMPWTNWCLGTEFAFGSGEWSRPEIFCYSLSDVYPVFSGTCNRWTGIGQIWPDLIEPRHEDAMNMVFLNGERFDALNLQALPLDDPYALHMQRLIALRARVRDVVYAGRMMDRLGLSGMPERVAARVFVRPEPGAAVVTVVDRREEHAPWQLSIDTSALPWPDGISRGTLLTLDGGERPVELRREGAAIHVDLRDQGEVCALRLEG